ncbi:unnamed protein product [Orchesella dallaii]|uniref:Kinectin n=1 Tax=Orchesella dallaii TaxID=48710 RepID=A0ABP1QCK0_9HEXA
MEMDLQLSLIAIGVACATAVAVYLVSVIGIKEKSFEEAIAEQKKRSDDLLGSHQTKKDKKKQQVKDKSNKKLKKREKLASGVNNNVALSSDLSDVDNAGGKEQEQEPVVRSEKKNHVEIVDEPEIMEDTPDEEAEDPVTGLAVPRVPSRRSSVSGGPRRDSIIKPILMNKDEVTPVMSSKHEVEPANHFELSHPKDDCEMRKKVDEESTPPSPRIGLKSSGSNTPDNDVQDSPQTGGKRSERVRSKPKKQVADEPLTGIKIENMIDRVVLSSSEIQNLIDVLLNKQHAGDSEWINKTKSDNSVGALKKQLEAKEKLLQEENGTVNTLQNKLKELRNEFNNERSKFTSVRRTLEEQLSKQNMEMQNLQVRFKQVGEISLNEKQELQKQLQRMQIKFKDVQDEYEAIKADYRNYRDAEQTIRSKADTLERESGALKTQCGHLENQLKNAFQSNKEMSNQLMSLQEHVRVVEERKKSDDVMLNNEYRKLQDQNTLLLSELSSLKPNLAGLENENSNLRNQVGLLENQLKSVEEVNKKYEEARTAEVALRNVVNELKGDVGRLEDQVRSKDHTVEQLKNENETLKREVEQRKQVNGDVQEQTTNQVKGLNDKIQTSTLEIQRLNNELTKLNDEVKEKSVKNDELRHKNQKLVESLNVTEQSLQTKIEGMEKRDSAELLHKSAVAKAVKNTLGDDVDLSSEDWMVRVMDRVQDKLKAVSNAPVHENGVADKEVEELKTEQKKLKDEVVHYQGMLKETENLLSTLQASINVEESKWVAQNNEKEKEIERLLSLSAELDTIRESMEEHKKARTDLEVKLAALQNGSPDTEQLAKSNEALQGELDSARQRCEDLKMELSRVQQGSTPTSTTVNGTSNDECSSNNESRVQVSSPPSPNINNVNTQVAPPSSPSTISAASSSPPAPTKEKKKKTKGSSKK